MRAPSAKRFRRRYAQNLGLSWLYPTRKELHQQRVTMQQHKQRVVLYCKTGGSNGPVWAHLCSYVPVLKKAFPEAEVIATLLLIDNHCIYHQDYEALPMFDFQESVTLFSDILHCPRQHGCGYTGGMPCHFIVRIAVFSFCVREVVDNRVRHRARHRPRRHELRHVVCKCVASAS